MHHENFIELHLAFHVGTLLAITSPSRLTGSSKTMKFCQRPQWNISSLNERVKFYIDDDNLNKFRYNAVNCGYSKLFLSTLIFWLLSSSRLFYFY